MSNNDEGGRKAPTSPATPDDHQPKEINNMNTTDNTATTDPAAAQALLHQLHTDHLLTNREAQRISARVGALLAAQGNVVRREMSQTVTTALAGGPQCIGDPIPEGAADDYVPKFNIHACSKAAQRGFDSVLDAQAIHAALSADVIARCSNTADAYKALVDVAATYTITYGLQPDAVVAALEDAASSDAFPPGVDIRRLVENGHAEWWEISAETQARAARMFGELDFGQSAATRGKFKSSAQMQTVVAPPEYLVKGLIDASTYTRLNGRTNHGKSMMLLDMACCVATGKAWMGHRVRQSRVVYMVTEGVRGFRQRLRAWEVHYNDGEPIPAENLMIWDGPVQVTDADGWTEFTQACASVRAEWVILDTQAKITRGVDEQGPALSVLNTRCEELQVATQATITLAHHIGLGKENRPRGWSGISSDLDSEFVLVKGANKIITLTNPKQRDDAHCDPIKMRVIGVDIGEVDEDGSPVEPGVMVPVQDAPAQPFKAAQSRWQDATLPADLEAVDRFVRRSDGRSMLHDVARWMVHRGKPAGKAEARQGIGVASRGADGGQSADLAYDYLIKEGFLRSVDDGRWIWEHAA